jgi:hypothetical protein
MAAPPRRRQSKDESAIVRVPELTFNIEGAFR